MTKVKHTSRRDAEAIAPPRMAPTTSARNEAGGVAAVNRAIDILDVFGFEDHGLPLAEIAARTGMYKSTILRLLLTLERRNFICRASNGDYRLGPALFQLGKIYQRSFNHEDIVKPQLAGLVQSTGESASFFISDGNSRLCLYRVDSPQAIRHMGIVGERLPLNRGASGEILRIFSGGADSVSPDAFARIPSVHVGGDPLDVSAISGPVFSAGGNFEGAVSVSGPSSRFDAAARRRAKPALIEALRRVTARLGGNPGVFSRHRE